MFVVSPIPAALLQLCSMMRLFCQVGAVAGDGHSERRLGTGHWMHCGAFAVPLESVTCYKLVLI